MNKLYEKRDRIKEKVSFQRQKLRYHRQFLESRNGRFES